MTNKDNRLKVLYTELYAAERRLKTLRIIYSGNKDMKTLRAIQMAQAEVRKVAERIQAEEGGGAIAVWASEIEEFAIAVTKKHFPEEE